MHHDIHITWLSSLCCNTTAVSLGLELLRWNQIQLKYLGALTTTIGALWDSYFCMFMCIKCTTFIVYIQFSCWQLLRRGLTVWLCPTTTAISVWAIPIWTRKLANRKNWCPAPTAAALVRRNKRRKPTKKSNTMLFFHHISFLFFPFLRSSLVPAVHPGDDGGGEDVPVAVHRVQVLQHVRHVGERCTFGLPVSRAHTHTRAFSRCIVYSRYNVRVTHS